MKTLLIIVLVAVLAVAGYYAFRPHSAVAPEYTATPSPTASVTTTPTPSPTTSATPKKSASPTPGLQVDQTSIFRVSIAGFAFSPATVTVKQGDVVVFTNNDSVQHTVTSDTGAFTGGSVAPGNELTVATANLAKGTYAFHCAIHPSMHGTIIVQ